MIVDDHHKPILAYTRPMKGYYLPEFSPRRPTTVYIPNKPYVNFGRFVFIFISNTSQTLRSIDGSDRSIGPSLWYSIGTTTVATIHRHCFAMSFGSATSPHDMNRYELYSVHTQLRQIGGVSFVERTSTSTTLWTYHQYGFSHPSLSCGEVGLYLAAAVGGYSFVNGRFLLARAIIDPVVEKYAGTNYEEGWRFDFPSNFTPVLPSLLAYAGYYFDLTTGGGILGFRDRTGTPIGIRGHAPIAGSPDVMIGSNNAPPSPSDYALKSPIGSLSGVSTSLEIDTTLMEIRIVAQGSYTPTSNVYLGEVGLFLNLYDTGNTARYVMVARAVWDVPILLQANQTYAIGIVLRFA